MLKLLNIKINSIWICYMIDASMAHVCTITNKNPCIGTEHHGGVRWGSCSSGDNAGHPQIGRMMVLLQSPCQILTPSCIRVWMCLCLCEWLNEAGCIKRFERSEQKSHFVDIKTLNAQTLIYYFLQHIKLLLKLFSLLTPQTSSKAICLSSLIRSKMSTHKE